MGNIFYFQWEVDLIAWVQQAAGTVGTAAAKIISDVGGETLPLLLMIIMLFCYRKEAGKRVALTALTAGMWFPMIKNIVLRIRPYMAHPENVSLIQPAEADADPMDIIQQGFSFPSGHSANAASLCGSIARELRKKWIRILGAVTVLLIGLSRIAVGVHYPTDVLAGWAVGFAAVGFNILLEKKVKQEWMRYAILLAISLPGIFWCTSRDYFTTLGLLIAAAVGFPYEEKHIGYRDTRSVPAMILRCIGALAIYFVLNTVLKMPFSREFLNSGTLPANLVRSARYAIILFTVIAVYPRIFPLFEKIGRK